MERPRHIAEYPPHETGAEEEHVDERALFTWPTAIATAVMSAIGFVVGRQIGKWGDAPGSTLGRRVMGWVGALTGGLLAAYTSTKVIRKEQREAQREPQTSEMPIVTAPTTPAKQPHAVIETTTARYEGVASNAAVEVAR